ncbi:MAG: hypothetical protein ACOCY1_00430 [Halovenus sp.]
MSIAKRADVVEGDHELALLERDLRESRAIDCEVRAADTGARVWFDTWEPNPATRGEITASVCSKIAQSEHWELVRVHDPMEREDGIVQSGVTARRERDA